LRIIETYQEIKEKAGIERPGPENFERFKKTLSDFFYKEIVGKKGTKNERQLLYQKNLLLDFFFSPTPKQKKILFFLYKYSQPPTSIRSIHRMLGFGNPYSCQRFVSTRILQDMRLIEVQEKKFPKFRVTKINRELFRKYWPDIEEWKPKETKKNSRERTKKGQHLQRLFLILVDKIKEKGFTPAIYEEIKRINRGDFKERGWDIKARVLTKTKRKILRMPNRKLINEIEKMMAE